MPKQYTLDGFKVSSLTGTHSNRAADYFLINPLFSIKYILLKYLSTKGTHTGKHFLCLLLTAYFSINYFFCFIFKWQTGLYTRFSHLQAVSMCIAGIALPNKMPSEISDGIIKIGLTVPFIPLDKLVCFDKPQQRFAVAAVRANDKYTRRPEQSVFFQ